MKHIKKFSQKKKEETQEVTFDASSLEQGKEEIIGLGIKTEPVEHDEKELNKIKKDKIEKFEAFIDIHIDNIENVEWENEFGHSDDSEEDESDFDAEYEEDVEGCGCCDNCTGEPGCYCGCEDCSCNMSNAIDKASDVIKMVVSENLRYHLKNGIPVTESIFRPGSEAFFNSIKEARQLFESGSVELCQIDRELYETTEIGKFAKFNGEDVPLDLPMETIEELNEAEYKGKEVRLNYPMRGGTKKYYVYVKNPKTGKVKKISFGDVKGGLTAKVSNPEARKSFAARHKCSTKKDKTKAGYWACRLTRYGHLWNGHTYPGYW